MKTKYKNSLVEFYFGALDDEKRLLIEKDLLKDPECLLDYLDLKRLIEGSFEVPSQASPFLWQRLSALPKKKRNMMLVCSAIAAAAVFVMIYISVQPRLENQPVKYKDGILFDTGAEHSSASNVL